MKQESTRRKAAPRGRWRHAVGLGLLAALASAQGAAAQGTQIILVVDPKSAAGAPAAQKAGGLPEAQMSPLFDYDMAELEAACDNQSAGLPEGVSCGGQGGGLDARSAGLGLRSWDGGAIRLRGAPAGALPVAAWLYWAAVEEAAAPPAFSEVLFAGGLVEGQLLGADPEPCWDGESELRVYRAAVTDLVGDEVNDDYQVQMLGNAVRLGRDPWEPGAQPAKPLLEGFGLVIVYAHSARSREARVLVHEGPVSLLGELEVAVHSPIEATIFPGARLELTTIAADGQTRSESGPIATQESYLRDDSGAELVIRGARSQIDPRPSFTGSDGGPISQLWDTDLTRLTVPASMRFSEKYTVGYRTPGYLPAPPGMEDPIALEVDCVSVVAHMLTVVPAD